MSLRTGHGGSANHPITVEVLPADELPQPVPAPVPAPSPPLRRKEHGEIADAQTAKELGRRGGQAKAKRQRLIDSLGLRNLGETHAFRPYFLAAEQFLQTDLKSLARLAGGMVGPGPAAMLQSSAYQLAAGRYVYDRAAMDLNVELMGKASRLMNDSRQNRLAAYELAVREAQVRPRGDPLSSFMPPEPGTFAPPGLPPPIVLE